MTVLDVRLENGAIVEQALPTTYNAFLYVLEGEARIGEARTPLRPTQVGWLDRPPLGDRSVVAMANEGPQPMRLIFYAGERQNVPIVSHGPFIGDTPEDIARSFERYRAGTFRRYCRPGAEPGLSNGPHVLVHQLAGHNIERVLQRAQAGGHAASEAEIRAVHLAALANLAEAVRVFDQCRILDTSEPWRQPRLVARAAHGKCALEPGAPSWAVKALQIDLDPR